MTEPGKVTASQHPFELLGVSIATRLLRRPLGQARVALTQLDAGLLRLTHQGEHGSCWRESATLRNA